MSQHGMDQSDDDLILDPDDLGDDFMTTTTTQDRYTYDNMVSPKPIIQPDGSDDSILPDLGQNNISQSHNTSHPDGPAVSVGRRRERRLPSR